MRHAEQGRRLAYLARTFTSAVESGIEARYDVRRNTTGRVLNAAELAREAAGCDYLFVSPTETVSREVFDRLAGELKAVATLSVGHNHIDLDAAREYNVAVFTSPGVLTDACAEVAMLLVLNAARRGHEADALVRSGTWPGWAPTQLLGLGLTGRRMGILGLGRIGQAIAHRARAFGLEIHYHNRRRLNPEQEKGAIYHEETDRLLESSDVFLISAPSSKELSGFLDRRRIALLPDHAIVVNVARGDMIEDDALIEALSSRRVFAAGLDVFYREPAVDPRYSSLENVFLTAHIGSATEETRDAMGFLLLDGLKAFEAGEGAENRIC
jgi:glyoxylate reductase